MPRSVPAAQQLRLTRGSGLLLLAILLLLGAPQGAGAQLPSRDPQSMKHHATGLIAKLGEYYAQAVVWRDKMIAKTDVMMEQTRTMVNLRQQYARQAQGEMSKVGKKVADYVTPDSMPNLASYCAIGKEGTSKCGPVQYLADEFDHLMDSTITPMKKNVIHYSNVEKVIDSIAGTRFRRPTTPPGAPADPAKDARHSAFYGDTTGMTISLGDFSTSYMEAVSLARSAALLDSMATQTRKAVDSLQSKDLDDQELSSGRATQIKAIANLRATQDMLEDVTGRAGHVRSQALHTQEMTKRINVEKGVLRRLIFR